MQTISSVAQPDVYSETSQAATWKEKSIEITSVVGIQALLNTGL